MREWRSGNVGAFQALVAGSIPASRTISNNTSGGVQPRWCLIKKKEFTILTNYAKQVSLVMHGSLCDEHSRLPCSIAHAVGRGQFVQALLEIRR